MTAKITRPKFVLLDANIVIEAYTMEVWQTLIERLEVLIPSAVIEDEALFYKKGEGIPPGIRLSAPLHKYANVFCRVKPH
jgi:hypothetical protein